jgi:hypothetical protein
MGAGAAGFGAGAAGFAATTGFGAATTGFAAGFLAAAGFRAGALRAGAFLAAALRAAGLRAAVLRAGAFFLALVFLRALAFLATARPVLRTVRAALRAVLRTVRAVFRAPLRALALLAVRFFPLVFVAMASAPILPYCRTRPLKRTRTCANQRFHLVQACRPIWRVNRFFLLYADRNADRDRKWQAGAFVWLARPGNRPEKILDPHAVAEIRIDEARLDQAIPAYDEGRRNGQEPSAISTVRRATARLDSPERRLVRGRIQRHLLERLVEGERRDFDAAGEGIVEGNGEEKRERDERRERRGHQRLRQQIRRPEKRGIAESD